MLFTKFNLLATITLCGLLAFSACQDKPEQTTQDPLISDPELESIQLTIDGLYANIRVTDGQTPEIDDILYYFAPEARLGSVKDGSASLQSAEAYFSGWMQAMERVSPKLLKEWEIEGRTQYFGNIAYHSSKYGVYFNSTDSIAERGIINYQLVKLNDDWKVLSMIWHAEKDNNTIPEDYFE